MARNFVEYRLTGGQNTKDAADAINDGELQLAVNTRVDEAGCISSVPGETLLKSSVTTSTTSSSTAYENTIFGMFEAYLSPNRYIFVKSKQAWVRFIYSTTPATFAASMTTMSAFLPVSGYRLSGLAYKGYAYFADGYSLRRVTGTSSTLQALGVNAPTVCTSPSETQAGSSVAGAVHKWVATYYNGIAESNFSPPKAHTFSSSSKKLRLVIPVDADTSTGTTARRLYRTDNNGSYFYFVTQIDDNTTTSVIDPMGLIYPGDTEAVSGDEAKSEPRKRNRNTYDSRSGGSWWERTYRPRTEAKARFDQDAINKGNVVQTNLGILADWDDHDKPASGATGSLRNIISLGEVLFGILNNNTLAFSGVGEPEHWSVYNQVFIGKRSGETLLDIKPMGDDVICYTDAGIYKFRRLGQDATQSTLEQITNQVGVVSHNSVAVLSDGTHIFFARDGIYLFDGRQAVKISQRIDNIWTDSSLTSYYADPTKVSSVACVAKDRKAWFSYRIAANSTNNGAQIHVNLEFGEPRITVDTFNGYNSYLLGYDGTIFGARSSSIWTIESSSDGTDAVSWLWKTKQFPLQSALQGKRPVAVILDADLKGASTTLTVYGDNETTIATFTLTGTGRQKYRRLLPFKGAYNRVSLQFQSLDFDVRRAYSVAFEAEESDVTE